MDIQNNIYYKITSAYIQNPITTKWFLIDINNIYVDGVADVALIKTNIDFTNYPEYCLKINTETVNSGDLCYVVGNPGRFDEDSISVGCVRDPNWCDPKGSQIINTIFINAPSMGGNSGGPIVNAYGNVIGIYTFGYTTTETFGGGSNQSVLTSTLAILKQNKDNKSKLYLGLDWYIPPPYLIYYNYFDTTFDTAGVTIYRVNIESPFYNILKSGDLLLKCEINGQTIEFGNKNNQRTPGILLYYPVGTNVKIFYKTGVDVNVYTRDIILTKTYADVSNLLDGPLLSGYSQNTKNSITNKPTEIGNEIINEIINTKMNMKL